MCSNKRSLEKLFLSRRDFIGLGAVGPFHSSAMAQFVPLGFLKKQSAEPSPASSLTFQAVSEMSYSGGTSGTLSSVNIGAASPDRFVIVTLSGYTGGISRAVSAISIGGGTATLNAHAASSVFTATAWRKVTSGTTANISFTLNGTTSGFGHVAGVAVWTIHASSLTAINTARNQTSTATSVRTLNFTGSYQENDILVCHSHMVGAASVTVTGSASKVGSSLYHFAASGVLTGSGTNPSVTFTHSASSSNVQVGSLIRAS